MPRGERAGFPALNPNSDLHLWRVFKQFREPPADMSPQNSIFTTRSERDRIMECVLHYWPDRVWVTDVVHEWTGHTWRSMRSTYGKLRLTVEGIVESARVAGLGVELNEPHARQRLLVFTRL